SSSYLLLSSLLSFSHTISTFFSRLSRFFFSSSSSPSSPSSPPSSSSSSPSSPSSSSSLSSPQEAPRLLEVKERETKKEKEKKKKYEERYEIRFVIPRYFRDLSTPRVLTMERIEGDQIDDLRNIQKKGIHPLAVAYGLNRLYEILVFREGFVHADPHPGNLLVHLVREDDEKEKTKRDKKEEVRNKNDSNFDKEDKKRKKKKIEEDKDQDEKEERKGQMNLSSSSSSSTSSFSSSSSSCIEEKRSPCFSSCSPPFSLLFPSLYTPSSSSSSSSCLSSLSSFFLPFSLFSSFFKDDEDLPASSPKREGEERRRKERKVLKISILDHGLYCSLSEEFRMHYSRLWVSLLRGEREQSECHCRFFGVEKLVSLLQVILTLRSEASLQSGDLTKSRKSAEEDRLLRESFPEYFTRITEVLQSIPREFILLLKTNDLLRSIQTSLAVDERLAMIPLARGALYVDTSHFLQEEEERKRASSTESTYPLFSSLKRWILLFRLKVTYSLLDLSENLLAFLTLHEEEIEEEEEVIEERKGKEKEEGEEEKRKLRGDENGRREMERSLHYDMEKKKKREERKISHDALLSASLNRLSSFLISFM
ncbi:abc1 family protein, partial [Cystoisospora suis]